VHASDAADRSARVAYNFYALAQSQDAAVLHTRRIVRRCERDAAIDQHEREQVLN
jgi:cob(I)alamin adenosyltransferase